MISMVDSLEGLNKWRDKCTQTITDGFTRYSGGMTKEGIEAIAKYYYYLGACNAFVLSDFRPSGMMITKDFIAKKEWTGGRAHDLQRKDLY